MQPCATHASQHFVKISNPIVIFWGWMGEKLHPPRHFVSSAASGVPPLLRFSEVVVGCFTRMRSMCSPRHAIAEHLNNINGLCTHPTVCWLFTAGLSYRQFDSASVAHEQRCQRQGQRGLVRICFVTHFVAHTHTLFSPQSAYPFVLAVKSHEPPL